MNQSASDEAVAAAHELLLRFAGRLPDRQLWRFRDWLAAGTLDALASALPLTLLRERVAITVTESALLNRAFLDVGADPSRLSAVPWVDELPELDHSFTAEAPEWVRLGDSIAVVLGAVLEGRPEVLDVRGTWRRYRSAANSATRVLLVTASSGCVALTGELQRVLRALGTHEPMVEVLPHAMVTGGQLPAYHRTALASSEPLLAGRLAAHG